MGSQLLNETKATSSQRPTPVVATNLLNTVEKTEPMKVQSACEIFKTEKKSPSAIDQAFTQRIIRTTKLKRRLPRNKGFGSSVETKNSKPISSGILKQGKSSICSKGNPNYQTQKVEEQRGSYLCKVCGDRASKHSYYGGTSCQSCRSFFRRSVCMFSRQVYECG